MAGDECEQAIQALNEQFVQHLQHLLHERPTELWSSAVDMYAQHCEAIRQRYSAVLGTNALSPNTLQQHKILPNGHKDTHKEPAGQLHMCGAGDSGQLGLGEDVLELLSPKWLSLPGRVHVTSVACGGMHTLALTERGTVFSWGVNDEGALGRSASKYSEGSESTPKQAGHVYGWGVFRNSSGRFGFSPTKEIAFAPEHIPISSEQATVSRLISGHDHAIAITHDGELYSWGTAEGGRLGRVPQAQVKAKDALSELVPHRVAGIPSVITAACGLFTTMVVCRDGRVFGWGGNNCGQLALDGDGPFFEPQEVKALANSVYLACGDHHSLALQSDGKVLSFGRTTYGRLGRDKEDASKDACKSKPAPVDALHHGISFICCGPTQSGAIAEDGNAYTWGNGQNGQLFLGDEDDRLEPTHVKLRKQGKYRTVHSLSFGGQHCALLAVESSGSPSRKRSTDTSLEQNERNAKLSRS